MDKVIVTTQTELEALIESSVKRAFRSEANLKVQDSPDHLTVKQAMVFLDLAKQTIYGLTSRNEIPHYKRGKKLYFLKHELELWLKEDKQPVQKKSTGLFKNTS